VPSSSDNTPWWKRRAGVPKRMVICEWTIRIGVQVIHPPPNVRNRRAKRRAVRILGDAVSLDRLSDALYPMSRQGHGGEETTPTQMRIKFKCGSLLSLLGRPIIPNRRAISPVHISRIVRCTHATSSRLSLMKEMPRSGGPQEHYTFGTGCFTRITRRL
jgi:hypothetical protein